MKTKKREINIGPKQLKILKLMSQGYNDAEIAEQLNCSHSTIRRIIDDLLKQTLTLNRTHLISWAYERNILK